MKRLSITWPEHGSFAAFLRRHAGTDPAEKTWACPTCGTIPPYEVKPGLYLRRSCTCEEHQREAREMATIRRQVQAQQVAQTFTWIGQEWVERNLENLTFASFDRQRQA